MLVEGNRPMKGRGRPKGWVAKPRKYKYRRALSMLGGANTLFEWIWLIWLTWLTHTYRLNFIH